MTRNDTGRERPSLEWVSEWVCARGDYMSIRKQYQMEFPASPNES
jgi:hypothetical protein